METNSEKRWSFSVKDGVKYAGICAILTPLAIESTIMCLRSSLDSNVSVSIYGVVQESKSLATLISLPAATLLGFFIGAPGHR